MAPNPIIIRYHFGNLCIKGLTIYSVFTRSVKPKNSRELRGRANAVMKIRKQIYRQSA